MGNRSYMMARAHAKAEGLEHWTYARYLQQPDFQLKVAEIDEAIKYEEAARIGDHPFFELAVRDSRALKVWAEQEMITSSCFSQVITEWMATIDNCHIRSFVLPVFAGEHGDMDGYTARRCHPYLAEQLCSSLHSDFGSLSALDATEEFIDKMEFSAATPLGGAGFLGIGNERMLIAEYGAVKRAYAIALPDSRYNDFLDANIQDDTWHHRLIELGAAAMVSLGETPSEFLEHAKRGVDARITYYDQLVLYLNRSLNC